MLHFSSFRICINLQLTPLFFVAKIELYHIFLRVSVTIGHWFITKDLTNH